MSSVDPFDDLLDLEDDFYKEGYDAGVADSAYAGLIEGKVFGIEKGYEKALELGRLHGRALVWKHRLQADQAGADAEHEVSMQDDLSSKMTQHLPRLPDNARLKKHIDVLFALTESKTLLKDNSDEAVTEIDERITKTKARAKMISTMTGEANSSKASSAAGIEESDGMSARH